TQPKDRRVYTPLTGSSAWPETAAKRGRLAGQDTQAQRLERGCTVMKRRKAMEKMIEHSNHL
ncbi:MAG: hypothetical protein ACLUOI_38790, partial [Eisenbergiella sp.]